MSKEPNHPDRFFEKLVEGSSLPGDIHFEALLDKLDLSSKLEQAGVLPRTDDPNPFHHELEEKKHKQWWREHPIEGEDFMKNCDKREEVLKYLYIGVVLGFQLYSLFPQSTSSRRGSSEKGTMHHRS